ncbi:hypothetical protein NE619_17430 [Anaerovorax odorimutans]|uniref:Uncharacterized protein n=1 Tax=Anaerovorax odorimutans TaxID=109327 RepID=A0ABT1RTK2_9FIRM|nr:hypothetical protein [Anaerovorax odorimutans]
MQVFIECFIVNFLLNIELQSISKIFVLFVQTEDNLLYQKGIEMRLVNKREQMQVNGGAEGHFHWLCDPHNYYSAPRDQRSADAWCSEHNIKYHKAQRVAKVLTSTCWKNCGKVLYNMPK